uniref:Uncharacterized protein n=1 Tax=Staphylococcus schleiferi TaxID=1295 RepID=A0A7Z7R0B5_STASC|nr:Uncharacterised protein [Staphylococcus schleiferi]
MLYPIFIFILAGLCEIGGGIPDFGCGLGKDSLHLLG